MKKPVIEAADIFREYFNEYKKNNTVTKRTLKIVHNIVSCRTKELGGHKDYCDRCGYFTISYNSCRNRHCPKCQYLKKELWILDKKKDVLPVQYFHIVFTLPSKLYSLAFKNRKIIYSLLFRAVSQTIKELGLSKKHIGAKTGAVSILHTWGQKINYHPHIHSIVPGGGFNRTNSKWIHSKKNYFINVTVMSKRFRRIFLDALKKLYAENKLFLEGNLDRFKDRMIFQLLIDELYRVDWVCYAKKTFKKPETVIEYLARYTHRIAVSNYRIKKLSDGYVYFSYRDYKDNNRKKILKITALQFIRRFLLHTLPHRFVRIRYSGFLSNRTRAYYINLAVKLLKIKKDNLPDSKSFLSYVDIIYYLTGTDILKCPKCGNKLKTKSIMPSIRAP